GGIIEAQEDGWDSLDRLVSVTDFVTGRSAHYNLDLMGNRTNVDNGPGATNYYMNPAIPPGDFQMNRYSIGPSNTARFYDANGNLISANGHTCNYNFRGQLTAVDNGAIKLSYYPDGRQFGKVSYYNTNLIIYAGEDIIQEFDFAAGNSIRYVTANGQVLRVTALNGHDYFSHPDQLANTIAMTDTNGSVVENFSYDEFGTPSHIASISGNPFLHQASRYEPQIGWYLSGDNYLDPAAGRFVAGPAMAAFIGDNQYNFPNIPLSVGPSNQWPHTGVEIFALATVQRPPPPPPPPPPTTGPCPHREISYMFFTPWHRTTSATHAVSTLPGHEPRTIAWADVKWQRELMAVWAHCTLQANHLGPHNCIEDGKAEVHTVFNEDSHYGLGQSQGPPQNHWTDESGIPVKP
ncbi:MAG TPA: hypothetical protein VNM37_16500, partial [Candidatus Dormibacteraeota bacterium]|nr:hypothetical protein [Candidatus Dormibacteraeota bacterium]